MLVLTRKQGEKIVIGENISVTVLEIDPGKIRLGIEAPRDIPIYREELLPRIKGAECQQTEFWSSDAEHGQSPERPT